MDSGARLGDDAHVDEGLLVSIGDSEGDRIEFRVAGRSHPGSSDYWDGNWLRTTVTVRAGGFSGRFRADLRAEEFSSFRDQLTQLYEALQGEAAFTTFEGQVLLVAAGDGRGHVAVKAELADAPGIGNRLKVSLCLDQTYLPAVLESLDLLLATWPVLGSP